MVKLISMMRKTALIIVLALTLVGTGSAVSFADPQNGPRHAAAYNGPSGGESADAEASTAELNRDPNGMPYGHPGRGPGPRALRKMPVKAVAPYGDFCTLCSKYGMGRRAVPHDEAINALVHYFASRGLLVRNIREGVRFMKADIYKGDDLVDRIVFDRVTGRIRSIY